MNDEEIKKNVVDELYWDSRVDASDIKTEVSDRKVKLEGSVPTYYDKTVVGRDAWNVPGVKKVENQLAVEHKVKIPTDKEIEASIMDRIRWNSNLSSFKLEADVSGSVATLTGTVDGYWKKITAETEAENVFGIVEIVNNIAVVPTGEFGDEEIAKDVVKALERRSFVSPDDMEVRVENGEVTLTGTVPSWIAYYSANNAAQYTLGVREVRNKLKIS